MRGMAKVVLTGNVGREPEMRYLASGTPVVNFSLAVNRRKKVEGDWVDKTDWYRVVAFGKQAESIDSMVGKGTPLVVAGTLAIEEYTGRDGTERMSVEVNLDEFILTGSRQDAEERQPVAARSTDGGDDFADFDDVPF